MRLQWSSGWSSEPLLSKRSSLILFFREQLVFHTPAHSHAHASTVVHMVTHTHNSSRRNLYSHIWKLKFASNPWAKCTLRLAFLSHLYTCILTLAHIHQTPLPGNHTRTQSHTHTHALPCPRLRTALTQTEPSSPTDTCKHTHTNKTPRVTKTHSYAGACAHRALILSNWGQCCRQTDRHTHTQP